MKNMIIGLSVKAVTALETGRNWAQSGKMTHRKAFVMGMVAALASMGGDAFAATPVAAKESGDPVTNVTSAICNMTAILQGPIGIGIILGCVVIAGLSLAFGGKNSTSLLISALIGGAVVFGAKALLGLVAGSTATTNTCTPAAIK